MKLYISMGRTFFSILVGLATGLFVIALYGKPVDFQTIQAISLAVLLGILVAGVRAK